MQFGRKKCHMFQFLIDCLHKKQKKKRKENWKSKLISKADKLVLIKYVFQYPHTCYELPQIVCQQLTRHIWKFWWRDTNTRNKVVWISWKQICDRKLEGGFRY